MRVAGFEVLFRRQDDKRSLADHHRGFRRLPVLVVLLAVVLFGVAGTGWAFPDVALAALRRLHLMSLARPLHIPALLFRRSATLERQELIARAQSGDAKAQYELFRMLEATSDSWRGEQWLRRSAEAGYAEAAHEMGDRAESAEDYESAVAWYRKAAVQGHGPALMSMGWAYSLGKTVPIDCWKARNFLSRLPPKEKPSRRKS